MAKDYFEKDNEIFFSCTFNEQMTWIGEEVERIIKNNEKFHTKEKIYKEGKQAYGKGGHTYTIHRLFGVIKADPKNQALLREINRAEQELIAFLYDEPESLTENEIFTYWNQYLWAYIAELESKPKHYLLLRGDGYFYDAVMWIGIYQTISSLREAYDNAVEEMKKEQRALIEEYGIQDSGVQYAIEHEKVMIHVFDETSEKWTWNIAPEQIFGKKREVADENVLHQ